MKHFFCIIGLLVVLGIGGLNEVDGAGPCGRSSPDAEALKMASCASAGRNENVAVPQSCCFQMKIRVHRPSCLCAIMLSNNAKSAGVSPQIAVSIPKRCNLADRPVGYNCGGYRFP